MSLEQAIGVTLGANIGTTVTSILIGFDLGYFSYFLALIGVLVFMFSSKRKHKYVGEILIGFGLLFIGLEMMGGSLKELKDIPGFEDVVANVAQNPVLGVIIGAILTALLQSSSAFIGITQSLFASGAIDLGVALSLMFGANIGTCITAILASLGGSLSAKRTSLFHILFNVSVSLVFLIFLAPYQVLVEAIAGAIGASDLMTIAVGHFTFNFIGMLIFLPLINIVARFLRRVIPGKDSILTDLGNIELDEVLLTTFPAAALDQTKTAIIQESVVALENIKAAKSYLNTKDKKYYETSKEAEAMVNDMDTKIQAYLLNLAQSQAPPDIERDMQNYLQVQIHLERISDLSENLVDYFYEILESGSSYGDEAVADLNDNFDLVINNIASAIEIFETGDIAEFNRLSEDEAALDLMEIRLRKGHYKRLKQGLDMTSMASYVFNDILSTMERIGDHAFNIARITIEPVKTHDTVKIEDETGVDL